MEPEKIILDPYNHADSVSLFHDYFKINNNYPDLTRLCSILQAFSNLPYENISKIIKLNEHFKDHKKFRLPEEIINDHISFKFGGTCFSLTFFLQSILAINNFNCYPVMADMKAGKNIHCCLIVSVNGKKYLVDPGYLLKEPLELNSETPRFYHTEFTGIQIVFDRLNNYNLFTFNKNDCKWRYCFQDRCVSSEEFLSHWKASFYKNSMNAICLTKANKNEFIYVRKYFMRKTDLFDQKNFNIKKNYQSVINEIFGIDKSLVEKAMFALKLNRL